MQIQDFVKHSLYKIFIILSIIMLISTRSFAFGGQSMDGGYGIEISNDGKKIRLVLKGISTWTSDWLDLKNGGQVVLNAAGQDEYKIRIFNRNLELSFAAPSGFSQTNNPASLCNGGKAEDKLYYNGGLAQYEYIEIDGNGNMRWCWVSVRGGGKSCGKWISYDKNYVCQSCPQGYTYNANRNICEAQPICKNGTYDSNAKKCYIGNITCPLGSQYQCITMADGKNYCSNLFCGDASYANNYENTDTVQGANDKQADGQVDENGNCLGILYIFNGQDKRCRPPGTQTVYNDCCKKDEIKLLNLVSLGKCNSDEQYLAKLRNWGQKDGKCHYIGEYCAEEWKWPGGRTCVQKKKTFCCFGSPLARIIQEQGRQQLGISWGDPKSPNCRGFTPEEFQKIDWNKIDFSEWINNEVIPNIQNNLQNNLQNTINNITNNITNKY